MTKLLTEQSNWFHGTGQPAALKLVGGSISVALGGGELGRGFYAGDKLWVAKTWAANKHHSNTVENRGRTEVFEAL